MEYKGIEMGEREEFEAFKRCMSTQLNLDLEGETFHQWHAILKNKCRT
jgi:hypothetical protein